MTRRPARALLLLATGVGLAAGAGCGGRSDPPAPPTTAAGKGGATATTAARGAAHAAARRPPRPGRIPPLLERTDVYAAGRPGLLARRVRHDPARVYVPNSESNTVDVIDQRTRPDRRPLRGRRAAAARDAVVGPAHALGHQRPRQQPDADRPAHRAPGPSGPGARPLQPVLHGRRAARDRRRRGPPRRSTSATPHTMRLTQDAVASRACAGVDHMDFTADGRCALVSCEFAGRMVVVDLARERAGQDDRRCSPGAMPQDVKLSPDGRTFYVADMASNGVWLIDARRMRVDPLPAAPGAAPTASTRAATRRTCTSPTAARARSALISFRTRRPVRKWRIPGGGSPDMGGVSADGRVLWLIGPLQRRGLRDLARAPGACCTASTSAPARMACACGRSPGATRSATRASCADRRPGDQEAFRGASSPSRVMSATTQPAPGLFRGRQMLNKVPEVTLFFWVIKILCTTVGETAADYLNENLGFGLTNTTLRHRRAARRRCWSSSSGCGATCPASTGPSSS